MSRVLFCDIFYSHGRSEYSTLVPSPTRLKPLDVANGVGLGGRTRGRTGSWTEGSDWKGIRQGGRTGVGLGGRTGGRTGG